MRRFLRYLYTHEALDLILMLPIFSVLGTLLATPQLAPFPRVILALATVPLSLLVYALLDFVIARVVGRVH